VFQFDAERQTESEMGPPPAAGEEKIVVLKAVGGEIGSASSLAPKLGPLGLVRIDILYFVYMASHLLVLFLSSHPRRLVRISKKLLWSGRVSGSW
jgi:hypothetical protein